MFDKKERRENKVTDLSTLPPCRHVLYFHVKRADYVSYIPRNTKQPQIQFSDINDHGFFPNGTTCWLTQIFPEDVTTILDGESENEENSDDDFGDEEEFESDDEMDHNFIE